MKGRIKLYGRSRDVTERGHQIIIYLTQDKKEKEIRTGYYSKEEHWDDKNALPKRNHPNFLNIINYLSRKKIELEKLLNDARMQYISLDRAEQMLTVNDSGVFYKEGMMVAEERDMRTMRVALNSFQKHFPDYTFEEIDEGVVKRYIDIMMATPTPNGNKRNINGVLNYLSTLSAIWNRIGKGKSPFGKARPKSVRTKNKALTDLDMRKIIANDYSTHANSKAGGVKNYLNYFLICFYLGGVDIVDLARFRYDEHVIDGRLEFYRSKTGVLISNKIFPEAKELLALYDCKPYFVPLAQMNNYDAFLPNMCRYYQSIKDNLGLTKKPYAKASRATFITRGQNLLVDERIVKQLVGHSENSIHSVYKDNFPYHIIDEAHQKIIDIGL